MTADSCDVAIVGAGAAGLATAIFAAETAAGRARITVLEGAPKVGAKILISGGGRCNVTNEVVRAEDFNGTRTFVRHILAAFDAAATARWFESLGVHLVAEPGGKLFPSTDRARTVLDALLGRCAALGVAVRTDHRVHAVSHLEGGGFRLLHAHGELAARRLVLACGGRSLPRTGSDGSGWTLARRLGHGVTETWPALVPLVLAGELHRSLSGVSHEAELGTFENGRLADRRRGSLLWTHFGISGPVVLDASRHWGRVMRAKSLESADDVPPGRAAADVLRCSFLPGRDFQDAESLLLAEARRRPRASVRRVLAAELPERLAEALAGEAGIEASTAIAQVSRDQRRRLAHLLVQRPMAVLRDRGWDFAEVTAGGVPLEEVHHRTMESRLVSGLHLAGEMLDCDGRIGGFNFQWAWSTGLLAGRAVAAGR